MPDTDVNAAEARAPARPSAPKQQAQGLQLFPLLIKHYKTALVLLLIYFIGYIGLSPTWIVIGYFVYAVNSEFQKVKAAKRTYCSEAAIDEKAAILARVDELPAWVYFPDVERAEWLNKMVKQMWPYIGEFVRKLLTETIQPMCENAMPTSMRPFRFDTIDMGDTPPRIGGIKVYTENVRRDEVIMDMEILYAGDAEIKVVAHGMPAGIKHLTIHGTLRVIFKPLVSITPLIGGLSVFFLTVPSVDFDLTNLANLLDIPLLSNSLRGALENIIASLLVLPNKIPIQLIKEIDINKLRFPMPQGIIRIHLVAARQLKKADTGLFGKSSDPYCKIFVGAQAFKTQIVKNNLNPVWNKHYEAIVDQRFGQVVEFEVLDDDAGKDDELGNASMNIESIAEAGFLDSWLPLENVTTGMIHVRAMWFHLSKDPNDLTRSSVLGQRDPSPQTKEYLSNALLLVTVDSAKGLPRGKKMMSEPNPFVSLTISNQKQKTLIKPKTTDPRWEQNFQFLILDPREQELNVQVADNKLNKKIGTVNFPIKNLLTAKDLTVYRMFQLEGCSPEAKLTMRLSLRILTSEKPEALESYVLESPNDVNLAQDEASPEVKEEEEGAEEQEEQEPEVRQPEPIEDLVAAETVQTIQAQPHENGKNFTVGGSDSDGASIGSATIPDRTGTELRHRAQPGNVSVFGRIQLTLRYSPNMNKLICSVHKCVNLIPLDEDNFSDPYVNLYLLPERSSTKKKTKIVKNDLNPEFDETFEWNISQMEIPSKILEVRVRNSVGFLSRNQREMGKVLIDLSKFDNLIKTVTDWYDLLDPENE